jgi:hypothetical protein
MGKNKLYVYLARLDRHGIEIVAGFPYQRTVYPTRATNIEALGMPPDIASKIKSKAYEKRMTHELYLESASSYESLKKSLRDRGYKNLPLHQFSTLAKPIKIDDSALVTKKSTMIRRSNI